MPRAHIVVHEPDRRDEAYRFDLIDFDGPRHGQRLADFDVPAVWAEPGFGAAPDPQEADIARAKLVTYGSRNGYSVVDDRATNPTEDPGRQVRVVNCREYPLSRRGERRRRGE